MMYNDDRAAKSANPSPPSSPSNTPGAWPSDTSHERSTKSWYDWFFGFSYSRPQSGLRYVFEDYAARSQARGPGITTKDIVDFLTSLPEQPTRNWFSDDQGHQVSLALLMFR